MGNSDGFRDGVEIGCVLAGGGLGCVGLALALFFVAKVAAMFLCPH